MNNQQCIIGVVNDVVTAKKLWQELSPAETIYDDFEFRETFRKYYGSQFFFYTASVDGKIVGLLPLQTVEDGSALEFFGGDYMEDNRVFTKPGFEYCIPELYQHLDRPAHLDFIRGIDAYTQTFPIVDYKYVLPLQQFATIDDYVAYAYEGKAWRDFNRKLRNVENSGITVAYDQYEDVDFLFKTNIEHYKDSAIPSMFARPYRQDIFRELVTGTYENFKGRLMTFRVNNEIVAVAMALVYKNVYESVNSGIGENAPKNCREYVQLQKIADAKKMGCTLFDAFVRDYGWKEKWKLEKIPQYTYPHEKK
jgi:CelD/BcsL family acetyltransferase involved in cellulose biosynthesis